MNERDSPACLYSATPPARLRRRARPGGGFGYPGIGADGPADPRRRGRLPARWGRVRLDLTPGISSPPRRPRPDLGHGPTRGRGPERELRSPWHARKQLHGRLSGTWRLLPGVRRALAGAYQGPQHRRGWRHRWLSDPRSRGHSRPLLHRRQPLPSLAGDPDEVQAQQHLATVARTPRCGAPGGVSR
jgi:hypothetical protein